MKDFSIKDVLGVRRDIIDKCPYKVLRFTASRADKDSVAPMYMAEDLFF